MAPIYYCQRCHTKKAVVGFGDPEVWVCQACYEKILAGVRALVERIIGRREA